MKNLTFEQRHKLAEQKAKLKFNATKRRWRRAARLNGYAPADRRITWVKCK